jgi:hypothetical protein
MRMSIGLVDLHGGDADVEHDAVKPVIGRKAVEPAECGMMKREPGREFRHHGLPACDRIGIAVERDDIGACIEDTPRIAACTERSVQNGSAGCRRKVFEHLRQHDRNMPDRSANGIAFAAMIRHTAATPHYEGLRPRFLNSSLAAIWAAEKFSGRHT